MSDTLVVELLTEELPPKALPRLGEAFAAGIEAGLRERGFLEAASAMTSYATPRRLAVSISHVADSVTEPPRPVALVPVSVAFDGTGRATVALDKAIKAKTGFDTAAAVPAERLERRTDGKLERLYYIEPPVAVRVRSALQEALDGAIDKLPIPKLMSYQGPDGSTVKFARPVHKLLAMHGATVVPVEALGLAAGRVTDGHRFLSHTNIEIKNAEAYAPTLEGTGKVWPSFAARRARIVAGLEQAAERARIIMPDPLLDEVTALVEWPAVYAGTFDRAFLDVPQECLILTMQQNQKYFALADDKGDLKHRFLLVSNIETADPAAIIRGNERVLRARLADAKFFYDQDRKTPLASRVPGLANVVYHHKLGSQLDRVQRLTRLAGKISAEIGANRTHTERAAHLSKADLLTSMVGEFPELQGLMGRYYATHDGEVPDVASAIEQQYWPRFSGDKLPTGPVAICLSLAEKLETLIGIWGIGAQPTGDKDPLGLRRAALGIIRILVGAPGFPSLNWLCESAQDQFAEHSLPGTTRLDVQDFIVDRLRVYLRDTGASAQEIDAVLAMRVGSAHFQVSEIPKILSEVVEFGKQSEALELAQMNKRVQNIIHKNREEIGFDVGEKIQAELLVAPAEKALYQQMNAVQEHLDRCFVEGNYGAYLRKLLSLRSNLATFFDKDTGVLVMDPDPDLRRNRAGMLQRLGRMMNRVADISKLAV